MTLRNLLNILYYLGMLAVLAGIILALQNHVSAIWIYSLGCIPILGIRVFNLIVGRPENRRKHFIMVVSALALITAAYLMMINRNYWIIFIAVAAVLDLYISFRRF